MSTRTCAAVAALLFAPTLFGQANITVVEPKVQAVLKGQSTVVAIPLLSLLDRTTTGSLSIEWLDRHDVTQGSATVEVTVPPGQSTREIPLPISNPSLWLRLRYTLSPKLTDARALTRFTGILSIAHIAPHVFELRTINADTPRYGQPFTLRAQAIHPVTRLPVSGVSWQATIDLNGDELKPAKITHHREGFVDLTFNLPTPKDDDPDNDLDYEITATLGDFSQELSGDFRINTRPDAQFQTDKPIYQPGQTIHLRAVVTDPEGKPVDGRNVTLRIEDSDRNRVHTAELTTTRFGIIHQDWTLPETASLGAYHIQLLTTDSDVIAYHAVRVSRYDLPTFQVSIKPDRTAYLASQPTTVTINGRYLFGKPVPKGKVKITHADDTVSEGIADDNGNFTALLDLSEAHKDLKDRGHEKFRDIQFAAFYTDPTSGKSEQRKFDIRITREPVHIYLITGPSALYVTTSYADGRPASASVDIGGKSTVRTNRYGVGKLQGEFFGDDVLVTATDNQGLTGSLKQDIEERRTLVNIEPNKTLYRAGEAVTLRISSPPEHQPTEHLMITAYSDAGLLAQRIVRLENHRGEVTFPYQPEFRRGVVFVAWNGTAPRSDRSIRGVIFPDGSDLRVSATADRAVYKPGDKASIQMQTFSADGRPVQAAIGLAVVDQSVMERARTDNEFGSRPWFYCGFCNNSGEDEIGGVRLNDLYLLKPSQTISPELDLVAEALALTARYQHSEESSETLLDHPEFNSIRLQMSDLNTRLDREFAQTLSFPTPESAVRPSLLDPWGRTYRAKFSVERQNNILTFYSSGPDKQSDTQDDFEVGKFYKPYFTPESMLIEQALTREQDYPATLEDFKAILAKNGLVLHLLRDPWGTGYFADVSTYRNWRSIRIFSAGPDRIAETNDDVYLKDYQGRYFVKETSQILSAIQAAATPPQSEEAFLAILTKAGIDLTSYPYKLTSMVSSRYENRIDEATIQIYGAAPAPRLSVTPVTRKYITFHLRSKGSDGIENTYDDFSVAEFPVLLDEKSKVDNPVPAAPPSVFIAGTGALTGQITDPSGAVMPNAQVQLLDAKGGAFDSTTNQDGVYHFFGLPSGIYSLRVVSLGFKHFQMLQIPVVAGKTTTVDAVLQVGTVSESVEVTSSVPMLNTESASISVSHGSSATPRVREYFPETLLWLPDITTDKLGKASAQFQVADSVTNWKVAVFASTLDGKFAQAESEFRSFQPFFLDFQPPAILTEGDQLEFPVTVRNYQNTRATVAVEFAKNEWSTVSGPARQTLTVDANSSANATLNMKATVATDKAKQRITATADRTADAMEKSLHVHPDGQETKQIFGQVIAGRADLAVRIPTNVIPTATKAELRIYPNVASLLWEGAAAVLRTPHGCAEQTISAGYSNLIALRFAEASGLADEVIRKRAIANVRLARSNIDAFHSHDGSLSYWSGGKPDLAVTGLALQFFIDAAELAPGEDSDIQRTITWLEKAWLEKTDVPVLLTSTVARSLAAAKRAGFKTSDTTLAAAYHQIAQSTDKFGEPYVLAQFILAAMDSGNEPLLLDAVERLLATAHQERGGSYWDLRSNSPFYGWGTAGRLETTGMVVNALTAWRAKHADPRLDVAIRQGLIFLINTRDSWGGWYSTQATLRTMRAIADASQLLGFGTTGGNLELRSNGRLLKTIAVPFNPKAVDPILMDVSSLLTPGDNNWELIADKGLPLSLMRLTTSHWIRWTEATKRNSSELRFQVECQQKVGTCHVEAERVGFKGYGMIMAEVGLPPGADVDRSSIQDMHYEVMPDKVVFYLWPQAGGISFDFKLTTRIPMTAKSEPSVLYDYYNPDARTEIAPVLWSTK